MPDISLHAALFRGFSEPSRLSILEQLRSGERRVSDIVAATGLTQPNVSTHLACLWDCGLVARERRGREVYYRLVEGVAELLIAADHILERAGDTVGACPATGSLRRQHECARGYSAADGPAVPTGARGTEAR